MKLNNQEIYNLTLNFCNEFDSVKQQNFPAKISFYIQKNRNKLVEAYNEIEQIRQDILNKYGSYDEKTGSYYFEKNIIDIVNKELKDLISIEQNINISMIKLSDLEGLEFTLEQMEALMFMIEED